MAQTNFSVDPGLGLHIPEAPRGEVAKTANYTIVNGDNGKMFTNEGASGAVTFTLPAVARGLVFFFFVYADQTVTVQRAGSNVLVTTNNAAAVSVAFSTSSEKIGSCVKVFSNAAGSKWLVEKRCATTMTVS